MRTKRSVFRRILCIALAAHALPIAALAAKKPMPEIPPPAAEQKIPDDKLRTADDIFLHRDRENSARRALALYAEESAAKPADAASAWRLAMASYFVAYHYAGDAGEQSRLYEQGLAAGRRAVDTAPDCAACHFWAAINLALWANARGPLKSLASLKELRRLLQRTLELDAAYAYGGADRLLGLIEAKLPRLIGGDRYKAREYFQAAIAAAPDEPMNYLELARLESEFSGRNAARSLVDRGLGVGDLPPERVESHFAIRALQKLRGSLAAEITTAAK